MKPLNLRIPSIVENLRTVESFVENTKDTFRINDDIFGNIMVAVTEGVNNAIIHGNKKDKEKSVTVFFTYSDSDLRFIIKDEGPGFDYDNLPDPTAPENIERPGGRGIFLMRQLADKVSFSDNGCAVELIFYYN